MSKRFVNKIMRKSFFGKSERGESCKQTFGRIIMKNFRIKSLEDKKEKIFYRKKFGVKILSKNFESKNMENLQTQNFEAIFITG
jgi:hypothetical protein